MRRPRITRRVLEGVASACGFTLAGPADGHTERDTENIEKAQKWAWAMLDLLDANANDNARRRPSSDMRSAAEWADATRGGTCCEHCGGYGTIPGDQPTTDIECPACAGTGEP